MDKNITKIFAALLGILGAMSIPASVSAQQPASGNKLSHARAARETARPAAQAATAEAAETPAATTYVYTLVDYPGTLNTLGVGINPGAIQQNNEAPAVNVVGAEFFPDGLSQTGFFAHVSQTDGVTENYRLVNDAQVPTPQQTYSINDLGQIVGDYIDANGLFHSYMLDCGKFTVFNVPFAGATGTYSPAINNSGEIVGSWNDSAGNSHSYTLIAGKFQSFDVPGASQSQLYYGINSAGEIVGSYADAAGNLHGFLRQGKTYTTLDFPGATLTEVSGINDAGVIVGGYCPTAACVETGQGELGFVYSKGVYTTFTFPAEFAVGLASINNEGVIMGNYVDAADLVYTFLATPQQ